MAEVVYQSLALSIHSHQRIVVLLLDAGLADDLSLIEFGVVGIIKFPFADFAGIADGVRQDAALRIKPALRLDELHFRERIRIAVRIDKCQIRRA